MGEEFVFDSGTEEYLKKIEEKKITIDPLIWEVLMHVLGNRTYAISLNLEDFLAMPKWILRTGSYVMIFLYKISGGKGKFYTIEERLNRSLKNIYMIKEFLERLREITEKKEGF